MTKELAIRILRGDVLGTNEQTHEAVFMAIRALKAEPVKHGEWRIDKSGSLMCSKCKTLLDEGQKPSRFCPNCGADMQEVEE